MGKIIISSSILLLFFKLNTFCIFLAPAPNTNVLSHIYPDTAILGDYDQITKTNSNIIIARVTRISNSEIFYVYPLNKEELSLPRKYVYQIKYATGKIEPFNPLSEELSEEEEIIAWEQVKILNHLSQTDTLIEISDFDALYESNKMKISTSQLEKNAITILKKKTANAGGIYLLITDKIINKAYGDLPSIEMYGKAYRRK